MACSHSTDKAGPIKTPVERWLTVGTVYRYYTPGSDAPPDTPNCSVTVPWIQMTGQWLKEAGFAVGNKVKITIQPGRLLLTINDK